MGLDLAAAQQKLLAFRDLLLKWNKTYNLTALRDPQQAISHHLLDSLAILPHVGDGNLLDVGSGGGSAGHSAGHRPPRVGGHDGRYRAEKGHLPAAGRHRTGLEECGGPPCPGRGNERPVCPDQFARLCRTGLFVSLTRHLLAPGGRWLAMKGVRPDAEINALPADIVVEASFR
jgi:16S rRNA (guanine527-N7)-methyltransferase